jgi:nitroreductase
MSIKDALRKRRSIRKYTAQPVPDELVLECLEAAGWAPSAHNSQPWRFIVVSNEKRAETVNIFRHEIEYKKALSRDLGSCEQTVLYLSNTIKRFDYDCIYYDIVIVLS